MPLPSVGPTEGARGPVPTTAATRAVVGSALVACLAFAPGPRLSAQEPCDTTITPAAGVDGYTVRTDAVTRCEGIYQRTISGNSVYFMAWTWRPIRYDIDSLAEMRVAWTSPDARPVRFTVDALPGLQPAYRVDAVPPSGATEFSWPATLAKDYEVDNRRFRAELKVDLDGDSVYVPVVANDDGTCSEADPQLVLFAGTSIRSIVVSTFRGNAVVGDPVAVDSIAGSRQRGRFTVDIRRDLEPGPYTVMVQAASRTTGRSITPGTFSIYHPGTWEPGCTGQ